jgi:hypothetical protein
MVQESSPEQRAHTRYKVREKIMLYNGTTFAEVVNISKGGILCRFLLDTEEELQPIRSVDLIDAPGKVFIQKIPCNDLNWHEAKFHRLFGTTALRDCRLKFTDITTEQESQLFDFIEAVRTTPCPDAEFMNCDASADA